MKVCFSILFAFTLINSKNTESSLKLSQITKLRSEFKQENPHKVKLPSGRKLSVISLFQTPILKMKSTYSPFTIDRYLKPILPRSLENNENELENEQTPKILKIEEINQKTGKVERVLRQTLKKPNITKNQETVKFTRPKNLRKVVGVHQEVDGVHHEVAVQKIEQAFEKVKPKKIMVNTRVAALYKDCVHTPFSDHVKKTNKVRERFEFNKNPHQANTNKLKF